MLLQVKDLKTSFATPDGRFNAVNGVSFDLDKGQSLGIIGESGSGKSVTALSIMRLIQKPAGRIESGEILFNGKNVLDIPQSDMRKVRGKHMSMIFQEPMTSLNPVFTVGNQIEEAVRLHQNVSKSKARDRCLEMLELVGIPDAERRLSFYPHQLSGGLRQRVMIAMALACEPELLIADEPTTALDVTIQAQILDLIRDLRKRLDMALIIITHDFGVIAEVADEVAVMYAGKILEKKSVFDIFERAEHPYTRALQKAIPTPEKKNSNLYSIPFMVPSLQELAEGVDLEYRWKQLDADLSNLNEYKPSADQEPSIKTEALLRCEGLKVHYPIFGGFLGKEVAAIKAVDGVSFEVKKGEVLGLVGESGCGKSTLGRSILRLEEIKEGEIYLRDKPCHRLGGNELREIRKDMQMIFQDPFSSLNPRMKVGDIVAEPFIIHSLCPPKERKDRVMQLLDTVGLRPETFEKYPHEFSGGQRQRIGIARALAVQPDFIVADEPVSALDVSIQAQILNLLQDLKEEYGLTYLFISHDLNVVHYLCDRILVMYDGKIVEELYPSQIFDPNHKKHEYTHKLIAAIPHRDPSFRRAET